jgi:hypothetical protein
MTSPHSEVVEVFVALLTLWGFIGLVWLLVLAVRAIWRRWGR